MAVTTSGRTGSALREQARNAIDKDKDSVIRLAHDIHAHPQLAFAEGYAAVADQRKLGAARGRRAYGRVWHTYGLHRLMREGAAAHRLLCRVRRPATRRTVRSHAEGVRQPHSGR